jgi:hypothetical protein
VIANDECGCIILVLTRCFIAAVGYIADCLAPAESAPCAGLGSPFSAVVFLTGIWAIPHPFGALVRGGRILEKLFNLSTC